MKKKLLICISSVLIVVLFCFLPLPTRHSLNLQAHKLNSEHSEIGIVEIPIEYVTTGPVFSKELSKVAISQIEETYRMEQTAISKSAFEDYYNVTVGIAVLAGDPPTPENPSLDNITGSSYRIIVKVSDDLDSWLIHISTAQGDEYYYVSSISGKRSLSEILEYFGS